MDVTQAIQTWNAGHKHVGTTFKTQRDAQAAVIEAMKADPDLAASCRTELTNTSAIVDARRHPDGTHGCIITADRHRTLTAILAASGG